MSPQNNNCIRSHSYVIFGEDQDKYLFDQCNISFTFVEE